ncbi:hypothetical protein K1T71_000039 [Dendrolimus kikuchii]|uniref:Uncharacterized protein n=1 Tax=Dendrolimus kikuchii TaxID=765133 RepID=A0ACC1DJR7_9NEOP|nr:hypothetical protein K1T71_000039 [Dendrolimus kikuchii]
MEGVNSDEKGSGDLGEETKPEEVPEPEVPVIPDVELVVDGFGFMPKTMHSPRSRSSNVFEKSRKSIKEMSNVIEGEEVKSPCASSTNIDIVRRYTWKTKNRMTVQVITYGATITAIQVPDRKGVPDDVVAGFDTLEEYFNPRNPYFGATIGRYANIIREGTMVVRPSGRMYMLSTNKGHHHYNGGYIGFDKVNWRSYVNGNKVIMSHVSDRFHEGFPGTVMAQVSFEVTCDNTIKIEMKCTTSEPTAVNLSNAPYFNLAGHHAGCEMAYDHIFTINADKYTVTDDEGIVTETEFYLLNIIQQPLVRLLAFYGNIFHCVEINNVKSRDTGISMGVPQGSILVSYGYVPLMGKQGTFYKKHGLFCLMPQNYPDAINHINFPNSVLNPGEVYIHRIQYKFGILLGKYV